MILPVRAAVALVLGLVLVTPVAHAAVPVLTIDSPSQGQILRELPLVTGTAVSGARDGGWRSLALVLNRHAAPGVTGAFWNWATLTWDLPDAFGSPDSPDIFLQVDRVGDAWSVAMPGLPTGDYDVYLQAENSEGGYAELQHDFTIDRIRPTVAITAPVAGAVLSSLDIVVASGTAADDGGAGVARVTVLLSRTAPSGWWNWAEGRWDATFVAEDRGEAAGTTAWSLRLPDLDAGDYELAVGAEDGVGNLASQRFVDFAVLDRTTPTATPTNITDGGAYFALSRIRGIAIDRGGSGIDHVDLSLQRVEDGRRYDFDRGIWTTGPDLPTIAAGRSPWFVVMPPLAEGHYVLRLRAIDNAGNAQLWTPWRFSIDRTAPHVTITGRGGLVVAAGSASALSGSAGDGAGSGVRAVATLLIGAPSGQLPLRVWDAARQRWAVGALAVLRALGSLPAVQGSAWMTATGTAQWRADLPPLPVGRYVAVAVAVDGAGNFGAATTAVTAMPRQPVANG